MKVELILPAAPEGGPAGAASGRLASLRGKVVGLLDNEWSAFDRFLNGVEGLLKTQAVGDLQRIHHPQRRNVLPKARLDELAAGIDTAIVGLGA